MSAYIFRLDQGDYDTLCWLNARGYDAGLLQLAQLTHSPGDCDHGDACALPYIFELAESDSWEWREQIDADPHAYLTCNGSRTLSEELARLENSII